MKKYLMFATGLALAGMCCFTACKKKETVEIDNETQSAVDNAICEQEFMAIAPTVNNHAIKTKGTGANSNRLLPPCDTLVKISGDTLVNAQGVFINPPTYFINVGNSACNPMPDTKVRQGSLTIKFTKRVKVAGAQTIIKFNNYKTNVVPTNTNSGISYKCDSMVITTVTVTPTFSEFQIKIVNGKCENNEKNWYITYSATRNIRHTHQGDSNNSNDITTIWGASNGSNRFGRNYVVTVDASTPLVKHTNCQYIQSGILKLLPDGFKERTVDYGPNTCDEDATFTVNGQTVNFKLK
jgi:hypothetical protein